MYAFSFLQSGDERHQWKTKPKNIYNIVSGNAHILHLKCPDDFREACVFVHKLPLRTVAARHRQTADVLDDGEAAKNTSLRQNNISRESQREARRGRHPIPPSFQQSSARHTRMKGAGLRGQESKGDWDIQREEVGEAGGRGGARAKRTHGLAWAGKKREEKGGGSTGDFLLSPLSPFPPLAMVVVIYCGLLASPQWNGRKMGS